MAKIKIDINSSTVMDEVIIKNALQTIAKNFSKDNLKFIAELSAKPNANEKFDKLKNNAMVNMLLK